MTVKNALERAFDAMAAVACEHPPEGVTVSVKLEYVSDLDPETHVITTTLARFRDANPDRC